MKLAENVSIATLAYAGIEPCIYWAKRGFGVRVYKNGSKTYVQSYRVSGRKRLLTVGAYPSLSREKAEDVAAAYRVQICRGNEALSRNLPAQEVAAFAKMNQKANSAIRRRFHKQIDVSHGA